LAFFLVLTFRHEHFYAPWEYPSVEAMRSFRTPQWTTTAVKAQVLEASVEAGVSKVVKDPTTVQQVIRDVQACFISVDTTPLLGVNGSVWNFAYDDIEHVQAFLDSIYLELSKHGIHSRIYGKSWLLRDKASKRVFSKIGSRYAAKNLGDRYDYRPLKEVGINPDSDLEVISVR
jgi:hypothetical protein